MAPTMAVPSANSGSPFEPAADIHAKGQAVRRFHVGLEPPIVFDCRMKPWYTDVLEVDAATRRRVDRLMPLLSL